MHGGLDNNGSDNHLAIDCRADLFWRNQNILGNALIIGFNKTGP